MNSKETRRPGSRRRAKDGPKRQANARAAGGAQAEAKVTKKRRRRAASLSPYGALACELLRLKEEFLKRNATYRSEVEALCAELPKPVDGGTNWKASHWKRLRDFVWRWDTAFLFPKELREHPYAAHRAIWDEAYGVVYLSPPESDLVVIGIDVRHDPQEIGSWVCQLVRDVRRHRKELRESEHRWKAMRVEGEPHQRVFGEGPDLSSSTRMGLHYWLGGFPEIGEEALRAWDWKKAGIPLLEIRNRLFPDAADLYPDHPMADSVSADKNPESARRKVNHRLSYAKRLIEDGGYRQLLPLTGARSRLEAIQQWEEFRGSAPKSGHEEGG